MFRNLFNPKTTGKDAVAGFTLGIESIPDAMASAYYPAPNGSLVLTERRIQC
jgi:hypothetical protein